MPLLQLALKEAAEIEINIAPSDMGIRESQFTPLQRRIERLGEHLRRKHTLHD